MYTYSLNFINKYKLIELQENEVNQEHLEKCLGKVEPGVKIVIHIEDNTKVLQVKELLKQILAMCWSIAKEDEDTFEWYISTIVVATWQAPSWEGDEPFPTIMNLENYSRFLWPKTED